jgi:hypothetical protein
MKFLTLVPIELESPTFSIMTVSKRDRILKYRPTFELIQRRRCFVWHTIPMVFLLSRFRAMVGGYAAADRLTPARNAGNIYYGDVHAGHDRDPQRQSP